MRGKKPTLAEKMAKLEAKSAERKKMFKLLCDHVAKGLSMESFAEITTNSVKSYFIRFPEDFIREEYEIALQKGRDYWEGIGRQQANGSCLGNSRTWWYNMANRYNWRDKVDVEAEHKGNVSVNVVSYASKKPSSASEKQD